MELMRRYSIVLVVWFFPIAIAAQDQTVDRQDVNQSGQDANAAQDDGSLQVVPDESMYEVPADASLARLGLFMRTILRFEPTTLAEYRLHLERGPEAVRAACELMLQQETDTGSANYRSAKIGLIEAELLQAYYLDEPAQQELIDSISIAINEFGTDVELYRLAKRAARSIEQAGMTDAAVSAYQQFADEFETSLDPRMAVNGRRLRGVAHRLQLIGQPFSLTGATADGAQFEWEQVAGKLVLVYFWSTVVGPVEAEMPELRSLYLQYQDRGFEVVLVGLDSKQQVVTEFLEKRSISWPCIFEEDAGWDHPVAVANGVDQLPFGILVDESGTVISVTARPTEVARILTEKFGN